MSNLVQQPQLESLPVATPQNSLNGLLDKPRYKNDMSSLTVLIVEDTVSELIYIEQVLNQLDIQVTTSHRGAQALAMHKRKPFDIVISDWRMPGMSGPELCTELKASTKPPYIILLTANNQISHNVHAIESGADDFMTKPFAPAALKAHIVAASRIIAMQKQLTEKNEKLNQALTNEQALNQQIQQDLSSACNLQQSLLPAPQLTIGKWQMDSHFVPATSLAGDIFGVHMLDEQHVGLYLLDVAGHGIAPAMQGFTLAQQIKQQTETWLNLGPGALMNKLASHYQDPEGMGRFTTLILATLELTTGQMRIANAGHPMPLIYQQGQWRSLPLASGLPLGVMSSAIKKPTWETSPSSAPKPQGKPMYGKNTTACSERKPEVGTDTKAKQHKHYIAELIHYQETHIRLSTNQRLIFFSDGLYEATHPKWGLFGMERLTALCQKAADLNPSELIAHLSHSISLWQNQQAQDDISMMILSAPQEAL